MFFGGGIYYSMLIKEIVEKKNLKFDDNYNDLILCERKNIQYGLLIKSGKTNKIFKSATELVNQGYGDCEVVEISEEQIENIFK